MLEKHYPRTFSNRPEDKRPEWSGFFPISREGMGDTNAIKVRLAHWKDRKQFGISFTPCHLREDGGYSFAMFDGGDKQSSTHFVLPAPRYSESALDQLGVKYAPVVAEVCKLWESDGREKARERLVSFISFGGIK